MSSATSPSFGATRPDDDRCGACERPGPAGKDVAAVGTAGHGNGLYLLDKQNAAAARHQSLDTRAAELAMELRAMGGGERLYAQCLQKPWPSQAATLLRWIKQERPDIYAQAGTAFLCKDALTFMLTGRARNRFFRHERLRAAAVARAALRPGVAGGLWYWQCAAPPAGSRAVGPRRRPGHAARRPRLPGWRKARRWRAASSTCSPR